MGRSPGFFSVHAKSVGPSFGLGDAQQPLAQISRLMSPPPTRSSTRRILLRLPSLLKSKKPGRFDNLVRHLCSSRARIEHDRNVRFVVKDQAQGLSQLPALPYLSLFPSALISCLEIRIERFMEEYRRGDLLAIAVLS